MPDCGPSRPAWPYTALLLLLLLLLLPPPLLPVRALKPVVTVAAAPVRGKACDLPASSGGRKSTVLPGQPVAVAGAGSSRVTRRAVTQVERAGVRCGSSRGRDWDRQQKGNSAVTQNIVRSHKT